MKYQPDRAEERSTKLEDNLKKLRKYNPKKQSSEIYRKELRYIEKKVGFNFQTSECKKEILSLPPNYQTALLQTAC